MPASPSRKFGLPRKTILRRRRLIAPLFDRARTDVLSVAQGCVRILYRLVPRTELDADVPVQVGLAINRGTGNAVTRNTIKRILREVYRTRQGPLIDLFSASGKSLTMVIMFRGTAGDAAVRIREDLPIALDILARELRRDPARAVNVS